jgi:ABC-type lipoprotein release transport system permease subunit
LSAVLLVGLWTSSERADPLFSRFLYYTSLAFRDLTRLWSSTQHHVVIVAGICLPILLLLGLKRGHVEELRRELITSPTGRQIVFWASQEGELLDSAGLDDLQKKLRGAELLIPDQQRVVSLQSPAHDQSLTVTLYSTRKGDPILAQFQADVLREKEKAVVLPSNVAESLGVGVGDPVDVTVRREVNGQAEEATIRFVVGAVYPAGGDRSDIGYVDTGILSFFEQFVRGYAVLEFGWQAAPIAIPDSYAEYLYLFEKGQSFSGDDLEYLANRGLRADEIDLSQPWELTDFIKPDSVGRLRVFRMYSESSRSDPSRRLQLSPSELTEVLSVPDDVAIPWNSPLEFECDGMVTKLVGLSLPRRCWLRTDLFSENLAFSFDEQDVAIAWPFRETVEGNATALRVSGESELSLPHVVSVATHAGDGEAAKRTRLEGAEIAVVPVDFLARLSLLREGMALFDPQTQLIAPMPVRIVFDKVRLFAETIDDVPSLAASLYEAKYAVQSEDARIEEIHEQDASLRLLVFVVGIGVFLFGVLTVISVLVDSTDRKRGTLGILRVMGVSKLGVFWIVVLRAAVIGVLAGCVSVVFGNLLAIFLRWPAPADSLFAAWKPRVQISLTLQDILLVFLGALVCAAVGAIYPAVRASRLDPFDAIVEGRFR